MDYILSVRVALSNRIWPASTRGNSDGSSSEHSGRVHDNITNINTGVSIDLEPNLFNVSCVMFQSSDYLR